MLFLLGFTISNGVPKVGVLQNSAWNLTDVCRFKLLPPSPAPSCSGVTLEQLHGRSRDSGIGSGSNSGSGSNGNSGKYEVWINTLFVVLKSSFLHGFIKI